MPFFFPSLSPWLAQCTLLIFKKISPRYCWRPRRCHNRYPRPLCPCHRCPRHQCCRTPTLGHHALALDAEGPGATIVRPPEAPAPSPHPSSATVPWRSSHRPPEAPVPPPHKASAPCHPTPQHPTHEASGPPLARLIEAWHCCHARPLSPPAANDPAFVTLGRQCPGLRRLRHRRPPTRLAPSLSLSLSLSLFLPAAISCRPLVPHNFQRGTRGRRRKKVYEIWMLKILIHFKVKLDAQNWNDNLNEN
jgi:hypothetical protein